MIKRQSPAFVHPPGAQPLFAARTRKEYLSEDLSIAGMWGLYKEQHHQNQELREVSEVYRAVSNLILIALFYHVGQFDEFGILG